LITPGRGKLIRDGLIKKKKNTNTSGKRDSGARLAGGKAKREGFNA
jgi:hypothetical protein